MGISLVCTKCYACTTDDFGSISWLVNIVLKKKFVHIFTLLNIVSNVRDTARRGVSAQGNCLNICLLADLTSANWMPGNILALNEYVICLPVTKPEPLS